MPSVLKARRIAASIDIPDAVYYKTKNGKHIYKDRWTEQFYIVYRHTDGIHWVIETWEGECKC